MNSNNNGSDGENNTPPSPEDGRSGKDNIIRIPSIGERDRLAREKRAQEDSAAKQQARAKVFPPSR